MQDELRRGHRLVRKPGLLHRIDEPHQFLSGMGYGYIVMLTLCSFLARQVAKVVSQMQTYLVAL